MNFLIDRRMLEETRKMFTFGYDSYIKYAFPLDELDPIHCSGKRRLSLRLLFKKYIDFEHLNTIHLTYLLLKHKRNFTLGRGPDYANPSNININDVLGDYSLTLIDVLDTLAIMGNKTEFQNAVKLVVDNVSFDTPNTVQVMKVKEVVRFLFSLQKFTFRCLKPTFVFLEGCCLHICSWRMPLVPTKIMFLIGMFWNFNYLIKLMMTNYNDVSGIWGIS